MSSRPEPSEYNSQTISFASLVVKYNIIVVMIIGSVMLYMTTALRHNSLTSSGGKYFLICISMYD